MLDRRKKIGRCSTPPPLLPFTNNKIQSSKETNLKMVNIGLRDLSQSGALWSDIGQGNT